jgi:hypothetical protein
VEYDKQRGIVFLLNLERPTESLTLYTLKLKHAEHGSDSDDGGRNGKMNESMHGGYKFGFIREFKLTLSRSVLQEI